MYRIACLAICGLGLVACEDTVRSDPVSWEAVLVGEPGWEHLSGSAVVQSTSPGSFMASAELAGDAPGAVRPWHVHFNSCAAGGGIVGADGDYPRLEVGADGAATASVTVAQPLAVGAAYHVNVHLSDGDLATIIACGDLVLDGS